MMKNLDLYQKKSLSVAAVRITDELAKRGVFVAIDDNFRRFDGVVAKLPGKRLTEQFSLEFFELHGVNAFWLHATTRKGKTIAVAAHRIEDIGKRSLAEHWEDQFPRIYESPNQMGKTHSPIANKITGKVVYTGDFWVRPKSRKSDLVPLIALYGIIMCQIHLDPDWIYALMSDGLVEAGFSNSCGFSEGDPFCTDWEVMPATKEWAETNWIVASARESVAYRAHLVEARGAKVFRRTQKTSGRGGSQQR